MSDNEPETIADVPCLNCGDDGSLIRMGPFIGCEMCFGLWAPNVIVEENEFLHGVRGEYLEYE